MKRQKGRDKGRKEGREGWNERWREQNDRYAYEVESARRER